MVRIGIPMRDQYARMDGYRSAQDLVQMTSLVVELKKARLMQMTEPSTGNSIPLMVKTWEHRQTLRNQILKKMVFSHRFILLDKDGRLREVLENFLSNSTLGLIT